MAGSRIHKIGSVFERISGLLETGVLNPIDRPVWYDVYKHHPPKYNPVFDRPPLNIEIKPILYQEDVIRAKIQSLNKEDIHDLNDNSKKSKTVLCQEMVNIGVPLDKAIEEVCKTKVSAPKTKQWSTIFEDLEDSNEQ